MLDLNDIVQKLAYANINFIDVFLAQGRAAFAKFGRGAFICMYNSITRALRALRSGEAQAFVYIPPALCDQMGATDARFAIDVYDPATTAVVICAVQFSRTRANNGGDSGVFKTIALTHTNDELYSSLREQEDRTEPAFKLVKPDQCVRCDSTEKLRGCSRCLDARYCSETCQRTDWPVHKLDCKHVMNLKNIVKASTR
jgi:MYND finger